MSSLTQDGTVLLRIEQSLTKDHAEAHAAAIATALEEVVEGRALQLVIASPEGPDAWGLAVLLAAARECRTRSVELRLCLPQGLSSLAEDLRLSRYAALEITEGTL